jgi:hypothetical protein
MKNRLLRCAAVATLGCGVWLLPGHASAGDLKLTMQNGRVTIIADNVPLRQILQEWARVGQTKIVNVDKMNGPAISLQLINAPERDALDILLRSASGYIAAPRPVQIANAAFYDRVTIMATSRPPAATATQMAPPTFQRPPVAVDDSDEPINVAMPPPQGNPVVGQFPGQYPGQVGQFPGMPQQQPGLMPPMMQPGAPTTPLTSPRPGAVQQPQFPPGVPNPYQPIRPPGAPGPNGRGGGPGGN